MKITSYFVGITVKKEIFIDLFIELQNYFKLNEPKEFINFQNILSLHMTLYYFGNKIDNQNLKEVKSDLDGLRKSFKKPEVIVNQVDFFEHPKKTICYISTLNSIKLDKINKFFRAKYKINVEDNNHRFIPHITIFKTSRIIFKKHQNEIENIIKKFINKNKKINIFGDINLYCVNSEYEPQIQIPIY